MKTWNLRGPNNVCFSMPIVFRWAITSILCLRTHEHFWTVIQFTFYDNLFVRDHLHFSRKSSLFTRFDANDRSFLGPIHRQIAVVLTIFIQLLEFDLKRSHCWSSVIVMTKSFFWPVTTRNYPSFFCSQITSLILWLSISDMWRSKFKLERVSSQDQIFLRSKMIHGNRLLLSIEMNKNFKNILRIYCSFETLTYDDNLRLENYTYCFDELQPYSMVLFSFALWNIPKRCSLWSSSLIRKIMFISE